MRSVASGLEVFSHRLGGNASYGPGDGVQMGVFPTGRFLKKIEESWLDFGWTLAEVQQQNPVDPGGGGEGVPSDPNAPSPRAFRGMGTSQFYVHTRHFRI